MTLNTDLLSFLYSPMWTFFCSLCRMGPLLAMSPPVRGSSVPMQVRVMIALMMAAMLVPLLSETATPLPSSIVIMAIQLAKEIMLGLLFGSAALIIVSGLQVGGQLASQLAGLDLASSADPTTEEESPVIGQFFTWLATALFLILGGHRQFMSVCVDSFATYPAGGILAEERWLLHLPELVQHGMSVGIRATAPLAIALLLANLVTAIIGRTLPQLNILAVGFNINAMALLVVLFLTIGSVGWLFQHELASWIERTATLFPSILRNG